MTLLTVEDQSLHDMNFLWENHSWDPSNSDNSGESKENMKSLDQVEEKDEALMNKKRNRDQGNITSGEGKGEKCRESDHEMHIWTERERRKKMRNMFASLHALLPHLPSKVNIQSSSFSFFVWFNKFKDNQIILLFVNISLMLSSHYMTLYYMSSFSDLTLILF